MDSSFDSDPENTARGDLSLDSVISMQKSGDRPSASVTTLDTAPYTGGMPLQPCATPLVIPPGLSHQEPSTPASDSDLSTDTPRADFSSSPIPDEILDALNAFDEDGVTLSYSDLDFVFPPGAVLQTIYEEDSTMFNKFQSNASLRLDADGSKCVPDFAASATQECAAPDESSFPAALGTSMVSAECSSVASAAAEKDLTGEGADTCPPSSSDRLPLLPPPLPWYCDHLHQLALRLLESMPMRSWRSLLPCSAARTGLLLRPRDPSFSADGTAGDVSFYDEVD